MPIVWNSDKTTYYDRGKKGYTKGDKIPQAIIERMGEETFKEYKNKGLIADVDIVVTPPAPSAPPQVDRDAKIVEARGLGLKPHYNAGIDKIQAMIDEHKAKNEFDIDDESSESDDKSD